MQEEKNKYDFDVALSYASEDRACAEALAKSLLLKGVNVFYDQYEKPVLWGKNLYVHLSDLYQNKAHYCVMFLSKHYAAKLWTNHEREAAQARALSEHNEYILPIRLDNTNIPGLLPTIAYLNWYRETVESITDILVQKLTEESPSWRRREADKSIGEAREKVRQWGKRVHVANENYWDWHLLGHALQSAHEAIENDPDYQRAWTLLADIYHRIGKKELAEECLQKSFTLATSGPNFPGQFYKDVKREIETDYPFNAEGGLHRQSPPSWFEEKYQRYWNLQRYRK